MVARSRALGTRRGLELWHHLRAQHKGVGPELSQRKVAALLSPERAASTTELQPAHMSLQEH